MKSLEQSLPPGHDIIPVAGATRLGSTYGYGTAATLMTVWRRFAIVVALSVLPGPAISDHGFGTCRLSR